MHLGSMLKLKLGSKEGNGYFAICDILPLGSILPLNNCDWSILMMHVTRDLWLFLIGQFL